MIVIYFDRDREREFFMGDLDLLRLRDLDRLRDFDRLRDDLKEKYFFLFGLQPCEEEKCALVFGIALRKMSTSDAKYKMQQETCTMYKIRVARTRCAHDVVHTFIA